MRLFLAGYGNDSPDRFFARIASCGADLAVDIRLRPRGRLPDYSGSRFLCRLGTSVGEAVHEPRLGNRRYRNGGVDVSDVGIAWLAEQLRRGRLPLLVCACLESLRCHRQYIAGRIAEVLPELVIVDVSVAIPNRRPHESRSCAKSAASESRR